MAPSPISTAAATAFIFFSLIAAERHRFATVLSPAKLGLKREKLSHVHFYFHDILGGRNPTAVKIVEPHAPASPTSFGMVVMIDDPLTERPELGSKVVGRAQGMYAPASQSEVGLLMVVNYVFVEGKYNGSSVSIMGRNAVAAAVREMPVVGGSGLFRFARGYAQARTHAIDYETGEAVVEYNVYVFHY